MFGGSRKIKAYKKHVSFIWSDGVEIIDASGQDIGLIVPCSATNLSEIILADMCDGDSG